MKIRQLSVFLENRSGRLAAIAKALGNAGINIRAMSLADTSDFGILRLVVSDIDMALTRLSDLGFTVRENSVVAAAVPDVPGALGNVLSILQRSGINVEYIYAFVEKAEDEAILIFRFDDIDRAIDIMFENGIRVIPEKELLGM